MCWVSGSCLCSLRPHCEPLKLLSSAVCALCAVLCVLQACTVSTLDSCALVCIVCFSVCALWLAPTPPTSIPALCSIFLTLLHIEGIFRTVLQIGGTTTIETPACRACTFRLAFSSRVPLCCPLTMCGNMDFTGRPPLKGSGPLAPPRKELTRGGSSLSSSS